MEVLRLLPKGENKEQARDYALVLHLRGDKGPRGDYYDVGMLSKDGDYTPWMHQLTLPVSLRCIADSIERAGFEYRVQPGDDLP